MKIVVIAHETNVLLVFREQLLREFIKAGHEVTVYSPENDPDLVRRIQNLGIHFFQIPLDRTGLNPIKDLKLIVFLRKTLQQHKPDVVFNIAMKPNIYGSLAARLAGIPKTFSLFTGLGYAFLRSNLRDKIVNNLVCLLCRLALKKNNRVFFQNPDDLGLFVDSNLVAREQVVQVNGSGVDLDHFQQTPLPEKEIVFLMIARFLRFKGIIEYCTAARTLKKRYPNIIFRLISFYDAGPLALTQEQINELLADGIIEHFGKTKDVRPYISGASIYVLPSYREGTPRSVLEAMSMGRSIITTDAPGCRETVVHGENGFLVPVRSTVELTEAMERFIQNPNLIKTMGQRSREIAEEKFDVHKVNKKFLDAMGLFET